MWRLCVEIMRGDYAWRLCVEIMRGYVRGRNGDGKQRADDDNDDNDDK